MNSSCQEARGGEALRANRCENALPTLGRKPRKYRPPSRWAGRRKGSALVHHGWEKTDGTSASLLGAANTRLKVGSSVVWDGQASPSARSSDIATEKILFFLKWRWGEDKRGGEAGARGLCSHIPGSRSFKDLPGCSQQIQTFLPDTGCLRFPLLSLSPSLSPRHPKPVRVT